VSIEAARRDVSTWRMTPPAAAGRLVISRAPLRISLGGGGTDLPFYSARFGGFVLSIAIAPHQFVVLHSEPSGAGVRVTHPAPRSFASIDDVADDLLRAALRDALPAGSLEMFSPCAVPVGSGLGGSGSFLVALLGGLAALREEVPGRQALAEAAWHAEAELAGRPVGKHDHYVAAYGGLSSLTVDPSGTVSVSRPKVASSVLERLERNLLLFSTGMHRDAAGVLREQQTRSGDRSGLVVDCLHEIKSVGEQVAAALEEGDVGRLGPLFDAHWSVKQRMSPANAAPSLGRLYELAKENGAEGGKLLGAGGGGFFLFYAEAEHDRIRRALSAAGMRELAFSFSAEGWSGFVV
jgi:D-glycero-alpha-D-manno-heptose-7-phosphate kinase